MVSWFACCIHHLSNVRCKTCVQTSLEEQAQRSYRLQLGQLDGVFYCQSHCHSKTLDFEIENKTNGEFSNQSLDFGLFDSSKTAPCHPWWHEMPQWHTVASASSPFYCRTAQGLQAPEGSVQLELQGSPGKTHHYTDHIKTVSLWGNTLLYGHSKEIEGKVVKGLF